MPQAGNLISSSPDASFHPGAPASKGVSDTVPHIRALAVQFVKPRFIELENGDLLIKDAPLLAEGEWTDSAQKTPLFYTAKALETYAPNWVQRTGWNRHLKGQPRDETNRVAEAVEPHYGQFTSDEGIVHNAILSDILVYGASPGGRAMQAMIKRKMIKYLSVEHTGEEEFNPETGRNESKTLEFHGFAFVPKGACKVCRFNEAPGEGQESPAMDKKSDSFEGWQDLLRTKLTAFLGITYQDGSPRSVWPILTFPDRVVYSVDDKYYETAFTVNPDGTISFNAPVEVEQAYIEKKALEAFPGVNPKELMALVLKSNNQEETMDTKELEAAVSAAVKTATEPLIKELAAIKESQKTPEVKQPEIPKELSALPDQMKQLAEVPNMLKQLADRLDALEKNGIPRSVGDGGKELESPAEYFVPVNRTKGTIGGDE